MQCLTLSSAKAGPVLPLTEPVDAGESDGHSKLTEGLAEVVKMQGTEGEFVLGQKHSPEKTLSSQWGKIQGRSRKGDVQNLLQTLAW